MDAVQILLNVLTSWRPKSKIDVGHRDAIMQIVVEPKMIWRSRWIFKALHQIGLNQLPSFCCDFCVNLNKTMHTGHLGLGSIVNFWKWHVVRTMWFALFIMLSMPLNIYMESESLFTLSGTLFKVCISICFIFALYKDQTYSILHFSTIQSEFCNINWVDSHYDKRGKSLNKWSSLKIWLFWLPLF